MFREEFPRFKEEDVIEDQEVKSEIDRESEVFDNAILENPEGFLSWFGNLKDTISEWPKKFFENKALKNAIIYTSIPFAVLSATKQEVKAEDIVSGFVNTPVITQKIEINDAIGKHEIKADDLISITDDQQKEFLAVRINQELYAFDKLSDSFNEALLENNKDKKDEIGVERPFDFAGRMKFKIDEANRYFEEISVMENNEIRQRKIEEHNKNIFQNGWNIAKILPQAIFAEQFSTLVHELGHEKEALNRGAINVKTNFDLFGGLNLYDDRFMKKESRAPVIAAGINADRKYGEFLINNLRGQDTPSQLLAIMALAAKSDGMRYALGTNFLAVYKQDQYNDILLYAKETNTSLTELTVGFVADFIFDKDNINLLNIAVGGEGIKIPKTTIAPFYELGERGPIAGIKFKGVF